MIDFSVLVKVDGVTICFKTVDDFADWLDRSICNDHILQRRNVCDNFRRYLCRRRGISDWRRMSDNVFNVPWPDPRLSSNKRIDRRALTSVRQTAREIGFYAVKEAEIKLDDFPIELMLVFFPPDARRRDLDNLYTSFKPTQDGIFEALNLDDSLIRRVILQWGPVKDIGSVNVFLNSFTEIK